MSAAIKTDKFFRIALSHRHVGGTRLDGDAVYIAEQRLRRQIGHCERLVANSGAAHSICEHGTAADQQSSRSRLHEEN